MKYIYIILSVALFYFNTTSVSAQSRFKASILGGLNLSQIHGDRQDGYRKKGLSLGLTGSMILAPDFDICTELLYNERGATAKSETEVRSEHFASNISLQYSEVALLAHYYFRPRVAENFYGQSFKIGFSYGKLLKSQTQVFQNQKMIDTIAKALTQNYSKNDISVVASWSFYLSSRLSVCVRHTNSLSFLYTSSPSVKKEAFENMRSYYFSFHIAYDFIAPKKVVVVRKKRKGRFSPLEEL